jgi:hypothetical protein
MEALKAHGGRARLLDVSKYVWNHREKELRASGDLFYTWQYDVRWAATKLRQAGKMRAAEQSETGIWELR